MTQSEQDWQDSAQPANDPEAEKAVIGQAMMRPAVIDEVRACGVTPAEFYRPAHEHIWRALCNLYDRGAPTDPVALGDELRRTKDLTKSGGLPYLAGLLHDAPSGDPAYYAAIIHRQARARRVREIGLSLTQVADGTHSEFDVEDSIERAALNVMAVLDDDHDAVLNRATSSWQPVDLTEAVKGGALDDPPTVLARDDGVTLLYAKSVNVMAGESESGKTWICLYGAAQEIDKGERVAFIDFEDRAERVTGRMLALGCAPADLLSRFVYVRPGVPIDERAKVALEPYLKDASLAVIDGVTEAMTMHGLDLLSNKDAAEFFHLLPRWIADLGPAVVLIDHVTKNMETRGRFAIGAQHKLAGIDGASYTVEKVPGHPFGVDRKGAAKLTVAKDRPGRVREYAQGGSNIGTFWLKSEGGIVEAKLVAATGLATTTTTHDGKETTYDRPTQLMEKVSRYVEDNPRASQTKIEGAVTGKAEYVRKAIKALVIEGYLTEFDISRGGKGYAASRPFRINGGTYSRYDWHEVEPSGDGDDEAA